jgi:hypothetical protein
LENTTGRRRWSTAVRHLLDPSSAGLSLTKIRPCSTAWPPGWPHTYKLAPSPRHCHRTISLQPCGSSWFGGWPHLLRKYLRMIFDP